jgi:hypothetical protein
MFVIPRTKHIASKMLDFPDPFRPVIELKLSSHPEMTVRTAYDLKPYKMFRSGREQRSNMPTSITSSTILMVAACAVVVRCCFCCVVYARLGACND